MIDLYVPDLTGKRIVCDLDHTICFPFDDAIDSYQKYGMALPNRKMIEKIILWKSRGAYIIIFTARRMRTHKGDVQKAILDVGGITEHWLKKHNVPYDELIFGKPDADVYIDDKAMNVTEL